MKNLDQGMTTETAIRQILKSPKAAEHIEAMGKALADETKRRHEFYNWIDENIKAEFINGQIIIHSPVKREHWKTSDLLSRLLSFFTEFKNIGEVGTEKVMISLTHNDYEPDLVFFKKEKVVGFKDGQVLFPAPDFVVEILSKKTSINDRTVKKADYAAHGIQEYWIIDAQKQIIEQYLLLNETDTEYFQPYIYRIDDDITSRVITGFTIPVRAIFDGKVNIETLGKLMTL